MNNNRVILIVLLIVFALVLGLKQSSYHKADKTNSPENVPIIGQSGEKLDSSAEFSTDIQATTTTLSLSAPNLAKFQVLPAGLSEAARAQLSAAIKIASDKIKANPKAYEAWNELAILRKSAEDYKGAIELWRYSTNLNPTDLTALLNIANVEHYYLKDLVPSEKDFQTVLLSNPKNIDAYSGLFDLYRYSIKSKDKAIAILKTGIEKNQSIDLTVSLAAYYEELKERTNAVYYYEKAIDLAKKAGLNQVAADILNTLDSLE